MSTRIYGASDDLIEFEGDFKGEFGCYNQEEGILVVVSDGTILKVKYGKDDNGGIWEVKLLQKGKLFVRIDICTDKDADPYSDVAHFKKGVKWAYAAKEWEKVG